MSFFVLVRDDVPSHVVDRFCAKVEPQFARPLRIDTDHFRLLLFGDQTGKAPAFHQAETGDFVATLGSLIFDGDAAPDCLPSLLSGFEPETFAWQNLIGTHLVLIRKRGRLYLFADGLGACKLYANATQTIWSNSFLAMLELGAPGSFDTQACYEYVCNGSIFGTRTLCEDIRALPANTILAVDDDTHLIQRPSPIHNRAYEQGTSIDAIASALVAQLDSVFSPIAKAYRDDLRVSFSGGFDSRLMLAMLMRHGARPALFVYGAADDDDVQIARQISRAEQLELVHVDKRADSPADPDALAELVEHDLIAFDGWKLEHGLFDFGVDRIDRLSRHRAGRVPLNGSLGEIYRNFFYMPDRRSSTGAVISTFYSPYDPAAFTERFDEARYRSAMADAMREAIGADRDALERHQVEALYPRFRGRFWTGRDAQINQRFGTMFFPYLEHAAISNTARVPIRFKDLGYLQGRMIGQVNSRLAAYPSDYGFALDGPRPLKYRTKMFLGTQRPPMLRKLSFRLKHRAMQQRDGALADTPLSRVMDTGFPLMRSLFHLDRIHSAQQFGLIATLEYLGQRYGLRIPPE